MITIPSLSSVDDILDSDVVMVTHSNGQTFKIPGVELNKRNQAVISENTTLTGAPLKKRNIIRAYFTADLVAANSSTPLTLSYNGVSYTVKVPKNGALANFLPFDVGGGVYKYLQAYTTLELLFDGTNLVVQGNPVVLSSADYTIYPDGKEVNGLSSYLTQRKIKYVKSLDELYDYFTNYAAIKNEQCGLIDTVIITAPATDFKRGTLQFVIEEDRGIIKGILYTLYDQGYNFLTFYGFDIANKHFYLQDFLGNVVMSH